MTPSISVVMPSHNEEELLADSVHEVVRGLRARSATFEVLVVENAAIRSAISRAPKDGACRRLSHIRIS